MTANACFLHQLRHDVLAWRWRLGIYWALLLLSFLSLLIHQQFTDEFRVQEWSGFLLNAFPGAATLLAALNLAGLVESATPYDPEAFGCTRPVRMTVVLCSRLLIFLVGSLGPWLLQQALLCQMAVGMVPWHDLWMRLFTGVLPYAAGIAFAVTLGSTARQKLVLGFAALLFLYFTRIDSSSQTDGVFALMPDRALPYLSMPKQMFFDYSWEASLPQPERWVNYQGLLLLIAVVSLAMAWWRLGRALSVTFFGAAVITCYSFMEYRVRHTPPYLTASQEQALGLEKITTKPEQPKLKEMAHPFQGHFWQLEFRPTFENLSPTASAMVAVDPATLTTSGRKAITGASELYKRWPDDQNINLNMRMAPAFRRAITGAETDNLSLPKKWSADELYLRHLMRPLAMQFVPKGSGAKSVISETAENASAPFSVKGDLALPITEYYVVARGPFRPGVVCHGVDGLDVHLTKILPKFRTARTAAGTVEQWWGVEAHFWMSSLTFDHHADADWTEAGELFLILYHPGRHEVLADVEGWYMGRYLVGTPIRFDAQYERLWLDESRIGTVDEHWLDDAEMILLRGRFAGTLKRELVLGNLKVELEKKKP